MSLSFDPSQKDANARYPKELASRLALHVLTDREWSRGRDMLSVAVAALDGGATVIQLRDKTASTHLGVGPIFPSLGKADAGPPTGVHLLTELAERYAVPLVAIGGITAENVSEVVRAGAAGVAVITAVVYTENITAASRQLQFAVEAARQ